MTLEGNILARISEAQSPGGDVVVEQGNVALQNHVVLLLFPFWSMLGAFDNLPAKQVAALGDRRIIQIDDRIPESPTDVSQFVRCPRVLVDNLKSLTGMVENLWLKGCRITFIHNGKLAETRRNSTMAFDRATFMKKNGLK